MNVSALGGPMFLAYTNNGGQVVPGADGTATVDTRDVPALLAAGAVYVNQATAWQPITAPLAATAGRIVASTTLANGTLTIAHQPDVPRQASLIVAQGSVAISGGAVALAYTANDGTAQVDTAALNTVTASTGLTFTTTKGVLRMTSAIVTGLAGPANAGVQVNDTNSLSLLVNPGFQDITVLKETDAGADVTIGTVASSAASITPSTAPNGTISFGFAFAYTGVGS
jgi:hypothetical protein